MNPKKYPLFLLIYCCFSIVIYVYIFKADFDKLESCKSLDFKNWLKTIKYKLWTEPKNDESIYLEAYIDKIKYECKKEIDNEKLSRLLVQVETSKILNSRKLNCSDKTIKVEIFDNQKLKHSAMSCLNDDIRVKNLAILLDLYCNQVV